MSKYDFSGYATRNDIVCSDGRTIRKNAFADQDGDIVPLVWQHQHNSPSNVLGHAMLENRDDGVYAYCAFNDTAAAGTARELVKHGDIKALSIYANHLKQKAGNVVHGAIREVSLVLTGANPGAFIDFPVLEHGDDTEIDEARIFMMQPIEVYDEPIELSHGDEDDADADLDAEEDDEVDETEVEEDEDMGKTVKEIYDAMTDEQKAAVDAIADIVAENAIAESQEDIEHSEEGDNEDMSTFNVFENREDDRHSPRKGS